MFRKAARTRLCVSRPTVHSGSGDGGNHRSLHFSAARDYLEEIMFQPHSYMTCTCGSEQSQRASSIQFLEFNVDYTKPLPEAWTLVNNWQANVDACNISWNEGLREVTTFTNGRTYALVDDNCRILRTWPCRRCVNWVRTGLRLTGVVSV